MSDSRQLQELFGLKERLEKNLEKQDDEAVSDLLTVLSNFKMTFELLSETRVGQSLGDVMKKFGEADVAQKAKKLLKKWKKELNSSSDNSSKASALTANSQTDEVSTTAPSISTTRTDLESSSSKSVNTPMSRGVSDGDAWGFEEEYSNLEPKRLSMVQAIMAGLLLNEESDEYWAKFLAFNIDREINAAASGDDKMYMSKARSIASNFRSNQALREKVYDGAINPAQLARMNPRELADKSVQEAITKMKDDLEKGRDTDMYQALREKAQQSIGINAEGGEFMCTRCKGTKTSHYSMQTRSSDEPMTVFVTCLTCRKRWRE